MDAEFCTDLLVSRVILKVAVVGIASEGEAVCLVRAEVAWLCQLWLRCHRSFLLLWELVCHYPCCSFRSKWRGILRVLEVVELFKDRHELYLVHIENILRE